MNQDQKNQDQKVMNLDQKAMNQDQMKLLEIGPYIRRTKLFDEFYGFYNEKKQKKVTIHIFHYIYNLPKTAIERIYNVLDKLKGCQYVQEFIGFTKDDGTNIYSFVYKYYPKSVFFLQKNKSIGIAKEGDQKTVEPLDYFTKVIPSFIYKGISCLQFLRNSKICHHDICLDNIYFGNPVEGDNTNDAKKKKENENPLKFDFRLLNWEFATFDENSHNISPNPRYDYLNNDLINILKKDPYKQDIWDFAIAIFSLFDKENISVLINQIKNNSISKINWDELLKNYHQYPEHCKKVKKIFEKFFDRQSSASILTNLIFSDLFNLDFFKS